MIMIIIIKQFAYYFVMPQSSMQEPPQLNVIQHVQRTKIQKYLNVKAVK